MLAAGYSDFNHYDKLLGMPSILKKPLYGLIQEFVWSFVVFLITRSAGFTYWQYTNGLSLGPQDPRGLQQTDSHKVNGRYMHQHTEGEAIVPWQAPQTLKM